MKPSLTLLMMTTVIALTSCEIVKIEPEKITNELESINPLMMTSYKVTHENADDLVEILYPQKTVKEIDYLTDDSDTLAFIYNFENGWIVIAGDRRVKPILGQSAEGQLTVAPLGIEAWLETCQSDNYLTGIDSEEINSNLSFWKHVIPKSKRAKNHNNPAMRSDIEDNLYWVLRFDYEELSSDSIIYSVPHLIKTEWGQDFPWNYKCPIGADANGKDVLCPTGCTAVAMAQVVYYMHYFKGKPTGLYHKISCKGICYDKDSYSISFNRGEYAENSPRWDLMAHNSLESNTDYVGDLMMDIGDRIGMTYSGTGSGAFPSSDGFSFYSLSCDHTDYSIGAIIENLNRGLPVLVVAYANKYKTGTWPLKKLDIQKDTHGLLTGKPKNILYTKSTITGHLQTKYVTPTLRYTLT